MLLTVCFLISLVLPVNCPYLNLYLFCLQFCSPAHHRGREGGAGREGVSLIWSGFSGNNKLENATTQIIVCAPLVSSNKFADELRFGDFSVLRGDIAYLVRVPDI